MLNFQVAEQIFGKLAIEQGYVTKAQLYEALTHQKQDEMRGRGVKVQIDDLKYLPAGSVLHWGFNHFVVLERTARKGIHVLDPASGPRMVPYARVREQFTGVALTLEPGDRFEKGGAAP